MTAQHMPLQGLGGFERQKVRQSYYMGYAITEFHPFFCTEISQCQHLIQTDSPNLNFFGDSPDNEIHCQIFGHRESLQRHILRDFRKQVSEVENRR